MSKDRPLLSLDIGSYQTKALKCVNGNIELVKGQTSTYIPTQIGFNNGKRIIGNFAADYAKNNPECVVTNLMMFVGQQFYQQLQEYTFVKIRESTNNFVVFGFPFPDGKWMEFTVTELLSFFIDAVMDLAFPDRKSQNINPQVVFEIPSWWHQSFLYVLKNACILADITDPVFLDATIAQSVDLDVRSPVKEEYSLLVNCGHSHLNIAQVYNTNIIKYIHIPYGGSNITCGLADFIYEKLRENEKNIPEEAKDRYQKFLSNIGFGGKYQNMFLMEVNSFKEKVASNITVLFDSVALSTEFELKYPFQGSSIYSIDTIKETFDQFADAFNYIDSCDFSIFEMQGGCGCSEVMKNWVNSNSRVFDKKQVSITQRLHPIESIVEGGIFYLQNRNKYKDIPIKTSYTIQVQDSQLKTSKSYDNVSNFKFSISKSLNSTLCCYSITNYPIDHFKKSEFVALSNDQIIQTSHTYKAFNDYPKLTEFCKLTSTDKSTLLIGKFDSNMFIKVEPDPKHQNKAQNNYQYFLDIDEEEIKLSKEKFEMVLNIERRITALQILLNDFQGFYLKLGIDCKKHRLHGFSDEEYKQAEKIANEARLWYLQNEDKPDYEIFKQKLDEFRKQLNGVKYKQSIREIDEISRITSMFIKAKPSADVGSSERISTAITLRNDLCKSFISLAHRNKKCQQDKENEKFKHTNNILEQFINQFGQKKTE